MTAHARPATTARLEIGGRPVQIPRMPSEPTPLLAIHPARTGVRLVWRTVAVGAAALLAGACDPCTGVVGCSVDPRVGVSGQIVERGDPSNSDGTPLSGTGIPLARPVRGVRIEVIPMAGAATGNAVTTTTDGNGWWQVSLPGNGDGPATVDVVVTTPGNTSYRVRDVAARSSRRRGDGTVVGRWTSRLYLTKLGEVIDWPSGGRREGTRVRAIRTGGGRIAPTRNTTDPMITIPGGRFLLDFVPLDQEPVVFDFVIERDGLPTATVRGVRVAPLWEWLPTNVSGDIIFYLFDDGRPAF